jgi:type IX secretion system PorP/SprF family membrane protein
MGRLTHKIFLLTSLICLQHAGRLHGQLGPGISMFTQNRIYLNPAYSGLDGRAFVQLHVRNQWTAYQTTQDGSGSLGTRMLSVSLPVGSSGLGFGLNFLSDLTPSGVGMQGAIIQGAYQLAVGESQISLGAGVGLQTKSFDGSVYRVRDSGDPTVEEFSGKQVSKAQVANTIGALFIRKQFHLGLRASMMNQAQEYTLHAEHTVPITSGFELNPFLRVRSISDAIILESGTRIIYQNAFWIGGSFRTNDALVGMIGATVWKNRIDLGYSIDYTSVNLPVKSLLTHEFFCRFNLPKFAFKSVSAPVKTPRFRRD